MQPWEPGPVWHQGFKVGLITQAREQVKQLLVRGFEHEGDLFNATRDIADQDNPLGRWLSGSEAYLQLLTATKDGKLDTEAVLGDEEFRVWVQGREADLKTDLGNFVAACVKFADDLENKAKGEADVRIWGKLEAARDKPWRAWVKPAIGGFQPSFCFTESDFIRDAKRYGAGHKLQSEMYTLRQDLYTRLREPADSREMWTTLKTSWVERGSTFYLSLDLDATDNTSIAFTLTTGVTTEQLTALNEDFLETNLKNVEDACAFVHYRDALLLYDPVGDKTDTLRFLICLAAVDAGGTPPGYIRRKTSFGKAVLQIQEMGGDNDALKQALRKVTSKGVEFGALPAKLVPPTRVDEEEAPPPPPPPPPPDFETLWTDPGWSEFRDTAFINGYLVARYTPELAYFLLDLDSLSQGLTLAVACRIYNTYIVDSAVQQINIGDRHRQPIVETITTAFAEAARIDVAPYIQDRDAFSQEALSIFEGNAEAQDWPVLFEPFTAARNEVKRMLQEEYSDFTRVAYADWWKYFTDAQ